MDDATREKLEELAKNINKVNKKPSSGGSAADIIFGLILGFALVVPVYMLTGFILADLWLWFVVPLGVVAIGKAHACGLMMLIFFMTNVGKERYQSGDCRWRSNLQNDCHEP
ncbi:hypothetical protein HN803_04620 [candidate division WWE3 bacterium]|jgi:hypothetical protein|nr:hypothetical protein [candidate division WWE3 bacterium]